MPVSDHQEHVTRALESLTIGLIPFVEGEFRAVYQGGWVEQVRPTLRDHRHQALSDPNKIHWDALSLLTIMWDHWNTVFRRKLSPLERSLVGELREFRNRWAHRGNFDFDDTYRTLDSVSRLLKAIESDEAHLLHKQKRELLEELFADEVNANTQRQLSARERWKIITINTFCGMLLVSTLFWMWDIRAWPFAVFISFGMGYLTFRSLTVDPPVVGIRECPRCRKIIYSLTCPYCDKTIVGRRTTGLNEHRNDPALPLPAPDDYAGAT